MNKDILVVLKTKEPLFWESDKFDINKVYRCLPVENEYIINGNPFTLEEYEMYFELAYDRVIRDWTEIGLVKDGKPIFYKEFKELFEVVTYGKQINNLRIGFVGKPKENYYKFYPNVDANKQIQLREMYTMYEYTLNGELYFLDNGSIQFGTFGRYISYIRK